MALSRVHSVIALWVLSFFMTSSLAQVPPVSDHLSAAEREKLRQELMNKGYRLLEEVVSDTEALRAPENRIRLQASVADLLWSHDEARARTLMIQAADSLRGIVGNLDPQDPFYQRDYSFYFQLRQTLVGTIARHDPELALDFLRSTRMPPPFPVNPRSGATDPEVDMEWQVANQVALGNPRRALEMAEASLSKGLTYQVMNVLNQLQRKDFGAAVTLANDIVKALQSDNLAANYTSSNVAVNFLRTVLQSRFAAAHPPASGKASPPLLGDLAFRKLLDLILSALDPSTANSTLSDPNNSRNLVSSLQNMIPELEKEPSFTAGLRAKIADGLRTMDPQARSYAEFNALMQKGTSAEGWLQAAARAPIGMRNSYVERASAKAVEQGDYDRARQILRENISDLPYRNQMLSNIDRQVAWQMMNAGKFEEARQLTAGIRSPSERARALMPIALSAAGKGNKKLALQILEEARGLIGGRAESQTLMNAQIELANAYANMDPLRAFEILESVADHIDGLLTNFAVIDTFEHESYPFFKGGELSLTSGNFLLGLVQQFSTPLAKLASVDFEHAKTIASRFQHLEVRSSVDLAIAQQALAGQVPVVELGRIVVRE